MQNTFSTVNALIEHDLKAKEFYLSLPDYVIGQLNLHSDSIHSFEDLKSYAKKFQNK